MTEINEDLLYVLIYLLRVTKVVTKGVFHSTFVKIWHAMNLNWWKL